MKNLALRRIIGTLSALTLGVIMAPKAHALPPCEGCEEGTKTAKAYGCSPKLVDSCSFFQANFDTVIEYSYKDCVNGTKILGPTGNGPNFTNQGCCYGNYSAESQIPASTCY